MDDDSSVWVIAGGADYPGVHADTPRFALALRRTAVVRWPAARRVERKDPQAAARYAKSSRSLRQTIASVLFLFCKINNRG